MTEGQDVASGSAWLGGAGRPTPAAGLSPADLGHGDPALPVPEIQKSVAWSGTGGAESPRPETTGTGWPGPAVSVGRAMPGAPVGAALGTGGLGWEEREDDEPFERVDSRKLETALLGLRHPIVAAPLIYEGHGVDEARAERLKLLSQIDDYLLPRLRQSGAPILVSLVGSTGAGKSTLLNSIVGRQVSATGIRRPTTNSPVLASHPDDMRWFAENVFLPTMPRVRQEGLAMPGRDGLLVLAASDGMPTGVALLDTPDIDSVIKAHRDFANQFLDASDLWLFVTTARRYADAAVWEMLKDARDRGASLAIALSRVPAAATPELSAHFSAMLEANGLGDVQRFIIPETDVRDAMLPSVIAAPVREWLADTAHRDDRRVAVLTQTMAGVLDTFRERVPLLADKIREQVAIRSQLRQSVQDAYAASLAEVDEATRDGSLLQGEVLARWQDFAGTGDLLRTLQSRRGRANAKARKQRPPARAAALKSALQASLESLVAAAADRAAEQAVAEWQQQPAGQTLLTDLAGVANRAASSGQAARNEADFVALALADLGLSESGASAGSAGAEGLPKATAGLAELARRAISSWQQHVLHQVKAENVTKRSIARVATFDEEALALVLTIGVLGYGGSDAQADDGNSLPQELLGSLFGAGLLRDMGVRIRHDLRERIELLFEEEAQRFLAIIDSDGTPEDTAAADLLRAGYELEAAR